MFEIALSNPGGIRTHKTYVLPRISAGIKLYSVYQFQHGIIKYPKNIRVSCLIERFISSELRLPFRYSANYDGNRIRTDNFEVTHYLDCQICGGGWIRTSIIYNIIRSIILTRLPVSPPPQGLPLYSAATTPGCKSAFEHLIKMLFITHFVRPLRQAPIKGFTDP